MRVVRAHQTEFLGLAPKDVASDLVFPRILRIFPFGLGVRIAASGVIPTKARETQDSVALSSVRVPRPLCGLLLDLTALSATPS